ncbi:hypothetical protein COLO4_18894 [Corchorus olitorius]|uniref:Uncharacterized protein n=1 Tax=Corchorus olitorius TaxID=93759 RepID=A0A1R3J7G3_9ROSI|nr:hypothetical protein COLO4_18894 [Corchorus olitorius]
MASPAGCHPLVVAAHPQEANQFAIGLSDGSVYVFEPIESEGKWDAAQRLENGGPSTSAPPSTAMDQSQG